MSASNWPLRVVAVIAFVGCAHSSTQPHAEPASSEPAPPAASTPEGFAPFQCASGAANEGDEAEPEQRALAEALGVTEGVDHIRLVRFASPHDNETFAFGRACGRASKRAACEAKLKELERAAEKKKKQVYAITNVGDTLTLYEGEAVVGLLGEIDDPKKAWVVLMVREAAFSYDCDDPKWSSFRASGDGFDVARLETKSTCRPFQRVRYLDHVDRDARVTRVSETVYLHQAERCIAGEAAWRGALIDRRTPAPSIE